jgi:hypothetical protein
MVSFCRRRLALLLVCGAASVLALLALTSTAGAGVVNASAVQTSSTDSARQAAPRIIGVVGDVPPGSAGTAAAVPRPLVAGETLHALT